VVPIGLLVSGSIAGYYVIRNWVAETRLLQCRLYVTRTLRVLHDTAMLDEAFKAARSRIPFFRFYKRQLFTRLMDAALGGKEAVTMSVETLRGLAYITFDLFKLTEKEAALLLRRVMDQGQMEKYRVENILLIAELFIRTDEQAKQLLRPRYALSAIGQTTEGGLRLHLQNKRADLYNEEIAKFVKPLVNRGSFDSEEIIADYEKLYDLPPPPGADVLNLSQEDCHKVYRKYIDFDIKEVKRQKAMGLFDYDSTYARRATGDSDREKEIVQRDKDIKMGRIGWNAPFMEGASTPFYPPMKDTEQQELEDAAKKSVLDAFLEKELRSKDRVTKEQLDREVQQASSADKEGWMQKQLDWEPTFTSINQRGLDQVDMVNRGERVEGADDALHGMAKVVRDYFVRQTQESEWNRLQAELRAPVERGTKIAVDTEGDSMNARLARGETFSLRLGGGGGLEKVGEEAAEVEPEEQKEETPAPAAAAGASMSAGEFAKVGEVKSYECTECGYVIFPAAGREDKFFGEGFKCPQCGAPKSAFKERGTEAAPAPAAPGTALIQGVVEDDFDYSEFDDIPTATTSRA